MTDAPTLTDRFAREINYVRLSVTDRCDFRCQYCMAEDMTFLPKSEVLSLEELWQIAQAFATLGVSKIRVTGGEPLIRRDVITLFRNLGQLGLKDLSLTTNGARLQEYAQALVDAGVNRVNISLDSLVAERFRQLTRTGHLNNVLDGIRAAKNAGFGRIKINTVVMRSRNLDEVERLTEFALTQGLDISFIEEMPLGMINSHQRQDEHVASEEIRARISRTFPLEPSGESTGGPSRYYQTRGYSNRIGFISPHSHNFCSTCNRVRVSAEGQLLLCLGNEHSINLKHILRNSQRGDAVEELRQAIIEAITLKPERHYFDLAREPQILRFMNATGG